MKGFSNLKIGTRLIVSFLVVAIIAGGIGVYSIMLLRNLNKDSETLFVNYGNSQG